MTQSTNEYMQYAPADLSPRSLASWRKVARIATESVLGIMHLESDLEEGPYEIWDDESPLGIDGEGCFEDGNIALHIIISNPARVLAAIDEIIHLRQAQELLAIIIKPGMIHELDAPDEQCYYCHQPEWEGHKDDCPWGRAEDLVKGLPVATLEAIPARELLRRLVEFTPVVQPDDGVLSCICCEAAEHEPDCPWRQAVELLGAS